MENKIIIDSREPKYIKEIIPQYFQQNIVDKFEFEVEQLWCADIQYKKLLIERKEINDFCSSVVEGRLTMQKCKMGVAIEKGFHVYVLIHGTLDNVFKGALTRRAYMGAIASLNEHGIHTINLETSDMSLLCEAIYGLIRQFDSDKPLKPPFIEPAVSNYAQKCMMCIPGIGEEMAQNIVEQYSDNLQSFFQVNPETLEKGLLEVEGIGYKKAKNIVDTLYQRGEKQ
ncbi:ERCC4 domain-containing protein [Methanosphaera sp.]|jgi:ERCC4-type nuclease|uniref:ERCC4 domain-containing protein n=1 Tax=Methanosphaera sp. TaxID=2666342 RepID=UPI003D918360